MSVILDPLAKVNTALMLEIREGIDAKLIIEEIGKWSGFRIKDLK